MNLIHKTALFIVFVVCIGISSAFAIDHRVNASLSAKTIMKLVDEFDDGDDFTSNIELTLIDRYGNTRIFKMKQMRKYFGTDKKDRYTRSMFYDPEPLKGISVLSYDYNSGQKKDDRWIYIPGIDGIKLITSEESGKLMGSDISYSDLNRRKTEDYTYKMLGEENVNGWNTWKIKYRTESDAIIKKYGYTKGIVWVDKASYRVVRAIFWVADKQYTRKFYELHTMKLVDGIWTPTNFTFMTKRKNEVLHITKMKLRNVKYFNNLPKHIFNQNELDKKLPADIEIAI